MVLIWGVNFPVAKAALTELSPLAFNALRFPLAALVVYAALLVWQRVITPDELRELARRIHVPLGHHHQNQHRSP